MNGKLSPKSIGRRRELRIQKPVKRGHKIFHKMTNWTLLDKRSFIQNMEGVEEVSVLYEEFSTGDNTRILVKANTKV